jgi:ABC-type sugar transport system permease subunit
MDGANGWQKLITLYPSAKNDPTVLMLGFIYTLQVFDVIWIIARRPGGHILPTFAYKLSLSINFGQSAA